MNSQDHLEVKRLLDVFAERPTDDLESVAHAQRRARVTSCIRAVLEEPEPLPVSPWRKVRWPEAAAFVAIAAGLAFVAGRYWHTSEPVAPVAAIRTLESRGEIRCDKNDGKGLSACDPRKTTGFVGLQTLANGRLTLETLIGVRLTLEPASLLRINEQETSAKNSRVTLTDGRVDVQVPKLGTGRQFSVVTPDTTVTVHGTAFSVTVRHDDSKLTHTCVDLREGVISVTAAGHTERLTAPARWGCDNNVTATPSNDTKAAAITTEPTPSISPAPTSEPTKPRHTLALETRLLQTALGAEQRRDFTTAEKNLRALLSSYPNSVVAPEARAALERVATKNAKQK